MDCTQLRPVQLAFYATSQLDKGVLSACLQVNVMVINKRNSKLKSQHAHAERTDYGQVAEERAAFAP